MNDEAELAAVLGHEVAHVAARHSAKRQSAAQRNTILGVLGQVLVGAVAGDSQIGEVLQQGIGTVRVWPMVRPQARCSSPTSGWRTISLRKRSEEHTSELQSLMRSANAVFCLKKNTYQLKNVQ